MATNNQLLLTSGFTSQDSITITHSLDRLNLDYRVIVGDVSRPDLVNDVLFTSGNERNEFTIRLTSSNTGVIQILDTDRYPTNLPTPENNSKLVDLPQASGITDTYVTGATLNSTTLELGRNQGLSDVTADLSSIDGTVTSVGGTGTVNGLTLGGTVTDSGNLTLGGTLAINNGDWSGADLAIANGGTGQGTAQAAIDALSQVSSATNEHVLTKDTGTGNATWKAGGGTDSYVTGATLNSTTLELERNEGLADVTVDLSGLTGPPRFFDVYDNTGGQTFTTGTITVNLDTTRLDSGDGAFTLASDVVTINKDATYVITYRVSVEVVGSNNRSGGRAWLEIDTGGGFSEVDGSRAYTYNRQQGDSENTAVAMVILDLNVGDELRVRAARQHGTATLSTIADSSSLSIFTAGSQGAKGAAGEKGDTGSGSNIIVQKDDVTVGTVTDELNFEGAGVTSVVDDGSNKTTVTIGGGAYGSEYDYNEDDTTSTTTSTSYQLKVTLTTGSLPAGNYEISWYSETNQTSTSGSVEVRVLYGTTEIGQTEIEHEDTDDWVTQGGFKGDISLSGVQTIELHYRVNPDTSGGTAAIRRARLKIIRVS